MFCLALVLVSFFILPHGAVMVFLLLSVGSLEVDLVCWCNILKINKSTTTATAAKEKGYSKEIEASESFSAPTGAPCYYELKGFPYEQLF